MVACLGFLHNPDNLLSSGETPTLGYPFFVLSALIDAKKLPKNCLKTSRVKPRLHERFFACDGDAIFWKLSRRQRAAKIACVAILWRSPWFCRKKFNSLNFSRFFFCDFFICRITCARVATHAIFSARWWRDNFQKNRITIASKKSLV